MNSSSHILFELEHKLTTRGETYIFARLLQADADFTLTDESLLNEVPIKKYLSMPRKLDEKGNIRLDVFTFILKNKEDAEKFTQGQQTLLKP